jgi:hypothetical protein
VTAFTAEVRRRAGYRCEYCRVPQAAFQRAFHVEHIVAKQHGGPDHPSNLALACWHCNWKKGPNLAGIDPETGQTTPLFHPRSDRWADHFTLGMETSIPLGIEIIGLTPVGRATTRLLDMNGEMRQMLRFELCRESLYDAQIEDTPPSA